MNIFATVKQISCSDAAQKLGLKGKGQGSKGRWCCPFHDDHEPSMACFDSSNRFYCFACGASGDAADLYGKVLNLSPLEAARRACEDFGYTVEGNDGPKGNKPAPAPQPRDRLVNRAVKEIREAWQQAVIDMAQAQLDGCVALLEKIAVPENWLWAHVLQRACRLQDNINHFKGMEELDIASMMHGYLMADAQPQYGEALPTPNKALFEEIMASLAQTDASWPKLTEAEKDLVLRRLDTVNHYGE